ncbi:MAG: hypothetical protein L3J38_03565 [Thiomicrorhabdus sp.]|nr:hypothetical protein [Thiomicrorhabdus sp.]
MTSQQVGLKIGTLGWQHDAWRETFYPEDLPSSWQLDYFSNVCRVALVPEHEWQCWSQEALTAIVESVEDDFSLYFALQNDLNGGVDNAQTMAQLAHVLSVLGNVAQGVVVWSEKPFDQCYLLTLPVTLISSQHSLSGWQWQQNGVWMSGNPLGFVNQLPPEGRPQVSLLTDFVESLSKNNEPLKSNSVAFIVGGEEINMKQVSDLKTIGELLGY